MGIKKVVVSDIETNGLLSDVTKFWCAWIYDYTANEYKGYKDLIEYVNVLKTYADNGFKLVFHNGIKYDIPVLEKLCGGSLPFNPQSCVIDTLVMGRLIYSNIKDIDAKLMARGILPKRLYGSHSLKAYGYRLGELKGSLEVDGVEDVWDEFTDSMYAYNRQDVVVTKKLYDKLSSSPYSISAIKLEHDIAWVMAQQERNGFVFDYEKAVHLASELIILRNTLSKKLTDTFGSWKEFKGIKVYKRDNKARGIVAGVEYPQYEEVVFNPASANHRAKVLMERGWRPTEFTPTGAPKTDEEALKSALHIKHVDTLLEYLMVEKRLSQLAEGSNAWLKMCSKDPDGYYRIHGSVNPNGAVTGRATHSYPNVAQVPSVASPYGKECRELFCVPNGWYQAGIDVSGLELRCFAEYLYPYDGGDYAHEILNGDIHTKNQQSAGLPTRNNAKTFIYGFLYGAGDAKIGEIVGGSAKEGRALKEKFLKSLPAIKKLRDSLDHTLIENTTWNGQSNIISWRKRIHPNVAGLDATHCLCGIDGRLVYVRSPHSALNTLLQSSGALLCKAWVVETNRLLKEDCGYKHGWDGDYALMAWVHNPFIVHVKLG